MQDMQTLLQQSFSKDPFLSNTSVTLYQQKMLFVVVMELCFEKVLEKCCHLDWYCLLKRF